MSITCSSTDISGLEERIVLNPEKDSVSAILGCKFFLYLITGIILVQVLR